MKRGKHGRGSGGDTWWNYCPTKKTRFASARTANRRLGQILDRPKTNVSPTHFYQCDLCGGWHLTANPDPGAWPYRPDLDEVMDQEIARQRAANAAKLIAVQSVEPEPEPEPEPEEVEELFSVEEGLDWIVAEHLNAARRAFNEYYDTEVSPRMFRPMVSDALARVRDNNRKGVYCTDITDPRHDGETCPTNHEESE